MTTSSDVLTNFGLRAAPFSKEIEDADLWLPESKTALVADIEEALGQRQSVLLLGEPGVGKTCMLRALRHRLPQAGFRLTYCRNSTLGRRDFYRLLCHALGLHPTSTAANLFLAVETHVHDLRRDKVHPVVFSKRLDAGVFSLPARPSADARHIEIDDATLDALLDGLALSPDSSPAPKPRRSRPRIH